MKSILLILSLALTTPNALAKATSSGRPDEDNLTRQLAQTRKAQIRSVHYDLRFTLRKNSKVFDGVASLAIELADLNQPLSVDFFAPKMTSVKINGEEIKDYVLRTGSFDIPAKYLKDKIQLEIQYSAGYSEQGSGLLHSIDPADKNEYLYTDLEPYYAHHVFPCFDQPDIKAKFTVTVSAPGSWKIISNELIASTKTNNDITETQFKTTPPLSPYLFFLGAGPFAEWKDSFEGLPLHLYARQSVAPHVDIENIFSITKKGLHFMSDFFGTPYPFSKYGQIFVPDFESEGMENPGAVTLDEGRIYRGQVSQARIRERENLILHEMAHMWFGDLVTMKWWDDLWLNESFASYLGSLAQEKALKSENSWIDFFQFKTWGLWQDTLITAHPIEAVVPDVRTSKGNFDGITYAKGAASLKQLHFLTGDAAFRQGLRDYFTKFAFQSTTRADFISALSVASGKNLTEWTQQWISSVGPNRISNHWTCRNGVVSTFNIKQKANASKILLTHRMRVGLYKLAGVAKVEKIEEKDVVIDRDDNPIKDLVGEKCPDFVFTNVDDLDYALHTIDPVSTKALKDVLVNPDSDPLTRASLWHAVGQKVRETELSLQAYFALVVSTLLQESNEAVLSFLLGQSGTSGQLGQIKEMFFGYLTPQQRQALAPKIESAVLQRIKAEKPHSNLQLAFFDFFVEVASTPETLLKLTNYLAGEQVPNGIKIDQDRRWNILLTLAQRGYKGVGGLITIEEDKDRSSRGLRNAYAARASVPTSEAKRKFWSDLTGSNKVPLVNLKYAAAAFNDPDRADLVKPYTSQFFGRISSINWKDGDQWVDLYFQFLFPKFLCSSDLLNESQRKLNNAKNLTSLARRAWLESNEEVTRCLKIRKAAFNQSRF